MQQKNILLHLSLINNVGPSTIQTICERKPASLDWQALYTFSVSDWMHVLQLSPLMAQKLVAGLREEKLFLQEVHLIERHGVSVTTILDHEYPEFLKHIHAPPPILYHQGADIATFTKCISIIGSRSADQYAKNAIELLVPPLVDHGWSIVSGGALGADAMAHAATVKAGGKTVVVLGSGLLHAGPSSNVRLFKTILAHDGMLLSTFPLSTKARPEYFPIRNRVIAGLSRGVIVVQAARKSGTRITAQYALEQGRDVFAIPGLIHHPLSEGCHALIQEGAKLISRVEDIFEEYGEVAILDSVDSSDGDEKLEMQQELFVQSKSANADVKKSGSIEERVQLLCKNPLSLDDLMRETNIEYAQLQSVLFDMQLDGRIKQNFAGLWHV